MGSEKLKPLANPKASSVAAPVISTGAQVESMPSATPPMMIVAGPVRAWSASSLVGAYSLLVEYSVHFPISQPATRPTITDTAMPRWEKPRIRRKVIAKVATTIATVEKLIPLARAASRAFCEESSWVRTW